MAEDESGGDWWAEAQRIMDRGDVLELLVVGCDRGGVLVEWRGLRGFVLASHLISLSPYACEDDRRKATTRGLSAVCEGA